MNPYKRDDLRAAWRAGRRAGQSRWKLWHGPAGFGAFQAFQRGFNSIEAEHMGRRQRELDEENARRRKESVA